MPQANTPAQTSAAPALPDGIEIFRAGTHTDDQGRSHSFSETDLQAMVAAYDPALREAPLTIGHPAHDLPAWGWVGSLGLRGDRLVANPRQVDAQFAETVRAGRYKKRSAAFYTPTHPGNPKPGSWYLRHVGFLGAQPPAIAGLADFKEGADTGTVQFSQQQEADMATETTAAQVSTEATATASASSAGPNAETLALRQQLQAVQAELQAARTAQTQFAEQQRAQRLAMHTQFCEAQVAAMKLQPKDKPMAIAALGLLADAAPVEFAEGDTTRKVNAAAWLQELISAQPQKVQFGEFAPGSAGSGAQIAPRSDAELDAAAKKHMQQHAGVSYAEALTAITSFTA